ncbi:MAG: MBL fold metallo-hydrolase [Pyrinomonadaceae bacterium]
MKLQLLPTTFDANGCATAQQHLSCLIIDDRVAIDAGSLATAANKIQREKIRDVVLTHAHLDHIAGLPLFIDDLFATLREPICIYATADVIEILDNHIFNWSVYPRFTELKNKHGEVLRYLEFQPEKDFKAAHLNFKAIEVNHKVSSVGFVVSDSKTKIAVSGDTAETDRFWQVLNAEKTLDALLVECAFPDELDDIAYSSHHLTPKKLQKELAKFGHKNCPVYVINLKPVYREQIARELAELKIENLEILEVGRVYNF